VELAAKLGESGLVPTLMTLDVERLRCFAPRLLRYSGFLPVLAPSAGELGGYASYSFELRNDELAPPGPPRSGVV
jgi:hypothetical protein